MEKQIKRGITIRYGINKRHKNHILMNLFACRRIKLYGGGNYFADCLPTSQCWVVWDKEHPEGITFADCELAWTSFDLASRIFRFMWNGMLQGDMKNKEIKCHPTQKPVKLYEWLLNRYAKEGDTILDTHVGSASSLVACHRTGHKYIGFEIDKEYYDKAKARLDAETAQYTIFDYLK